MISGIFNAFANYLRAFSAIGKYSLWKHMFALGGLSMAVGYALFSIIWKKSEALGEWLTS